MKEQIENKIKEVLKSLDIENVSFSVEHPDDFKNGDYSANVAMVCISSFKNKSKEDYNLEKRKQVQINLGTADLPVTNPRELAEKIKVELEKNLPKEISKVEVAGPGFINFYLSRDFFADSVNKILEEKENWGKNKLLSGKKVMVEYTDMNPFKPFHIGHLMANSIGESISRVVEFSGANTLRANYQGDVGPHVAKAIWGINHIRKNGGLNIYFDKPENAFNVVIPSENSLVSEQALFIGNCYHVGAVAYDASEEIKKEIEIINKKIYEKNDEEINKIYDWGREITLDAFEEIYKILGTKFNENCYFFESVMAPIGEKIVKDNVPNVFTLSDGAIVFHGENYDKKLHTRVFINSQGLPTYETKEIGLTITKFEQENPDISIVTTAIEQAEYMKVVQKAISLIHPDYESRMKHVTHGMMRFSSGKMSSRKGNVITGLSLLNDSIDIVLEKMKERELGDEEKKRIGEIVGVGALKYSILKSSLGSDIIYDFEKSISFEGDSGPYLQYTAVRANSIIKKSESFGLNGKDERPEEITGLEKMLYQFGEIVEYSYLALEPHHIATYLTELASEFNSFYGNTQILVDDNKYMNYHLNLVKAFYQTMKNGLWLLGIEIPERM